MHTYVYIYIYTSYIHIHAYVSGPGRGGPLPLAAPPPVLRGLRAVRPVHLLRYYRYVEICI